MRESDIQARVAARRAEVAEQARETEKRQREEDDLARQRDCDERRLLLDSLATEVSGDRVCVERQDDGLSIAEPSPLQFLSPDDVKRDELLKLFKREARQRWSPRENWLAIGFLTAGPLLLLLVFPLGVLLLLVGLSCRWQANNRHQNALKTEFPELFSSFGRQPESDSSGALEKSTLTQRMVQREISSFRSLLGTPPPSNPKDI